MAEVYTRLARALDKMPHGYPATEEGVELEILRKIFSPGDAAMAVRLKPIPETAAVIARRVGLPPEQVERTLDAMAERGQIFKMRQRGDVTYAMAPFVIGIWELQLNHIDRELAELFERYAPTLLKSIGGSGPALVRVVPVNKRIDARAQIMGYDDLRQLLESCSSFRVAECLCRKEMELLGKPCSHTKETCMSFARAEDAYEGMPEWGRVVNREEALALLERCESEGLVHNTYNVQREPFFVCNCCPCCCGLLRAINEHDAPYMIARSNYVAEVDVEACIVCDDCEGGERCPVGALGEMEEGRFQVDGTRCLGCGVCAVACEFEAIRLVERPEADRLTPPKTIIHWSLERTDQRRGKLAGAALRGWVAWEGLKIAARRRARRS
jgi:Na+-translocating ferredoxin:NAD+ oxidoreductase subunit B